MESETKLKVDGMTCGSCAAHVRNALLDVEGVTGIEIRLKERCVVVKHEGTEEKALVGALGEVGYESTPVAP